MYGTQRRGPGKGYLQPAYGGWQLSMAVKGGGMSCIWRLFFEQVPEGIFGSCHDGSLQALRKFGGAHNAS